MIKVTNINPAVAVKAALSCHAFPISLLRSGNISNSPPTYVDYVHIITCHVDYVNTTHI
jgi:hypothetical protein